MFAARRETRGRQNHDRSRRFSASPGRPTASTLDCEESPRARHPLEGVLATSDKAEA